MQEFGCFFCFCFCFFSLPCSPLENVSVAPLPTNFTEWHGNLQGPKGTPYEKAVFHFSIHFHNGHPRQVHPYTRNKLFPWEKKRAFQSQFSRISTFVALPFALTGVGVLDKALWSISSRICSQTVIAQVDFAAHDYSVVKKSISSHKMKVYYMYVADQTLHARAPFVL